MKTKAMGIAVLSAAALLGSAAAQAALPWTYAEVGYIRADSDEDFLTDAYDIKASVGLFNRFHVSLDYQDGSSETGPSSQDIDFDGFRLVAGFHPELKENTQLVVDLTYFDYSADVPAAPDEDTDGYGVGLGLRHGVSDKLELMGEVWYTESTFDATGPDSDSYDTSVEIGGRYNVTPRLSTGLMVALNGSGASSNFSSDDLVRFDVRFALTGDLFQ